MLKADSDTWGGWKQTVTPGVAERRRKQTLTPGGNKKQTQTPVGGRKQIQTPGANFQRFT